MVNVDIPRNILTKASNIKFSDLAKNFKKLQLKYENIKISNYYKLPDDVNDLFKTKDYTNDAGIVLNIKENTNIPVSGNEISVNNFKDSQQLGILIHNYNNSSRNTHLEIKNMLETLSNNLNNYDIIKIVFKGNTINSSDSSKGAIHIDDLNLPKLLHLNLYLETYVTGCHGKAIANNYINTSNQHGGTGTSSSNGYHGIVFTSSVSGSFTINLKKQHNSIEQLSGGFGGNGGAGGNGGWGYVAPTYRTIWSLDYSSSNNFDHTYKHRFKMLGQTSWSIWNGAFQLHGSNNWVFVIRGVAVARLTDSQKHTITSGGHNDSTAEEFYEVGNGGNGADQEGIYLNRTRTSTYAPYPGGDSLRTDWDDNFVHNNWGVTTWLYPLKHTKIVKKSESVIDILGQSSQNGTSGGSGGFPDYTHHLGNLYPSNRKNYGQPRASNDITYTNNRNYGNYGTGGVNGAGGNDIGYIQALHTIVFI